MTTTPIVHILIEIQRDHLDILIEVAAAAEESLEDTCSKILADALQHELTNPPEQEK